MDWTDLPFEDDRRCGKRIAWAKNVAGYFSAAETVFFGAASVRDAEGVK